MILDQYTSSYIDGKCFVSITYPFNHHDALLVEGLKLDELVEYIERTQISKVFVQNLSSFSFLQQCPSVQHIAFELRIPFSEYSCLKTKSRIHYDLSALCTLPNLLSLDIRENEREGSKALTGIDLSKLSTLQQYSGSYKFLKNLNQAQNIRSMRLTHFDGDDFEVLAQLSNLDTLDLSFSKIQTLSGCAHLSKLQCLYLSRNRKLSDISDLKYLSHTLKALRIENCPNIDDFSVLESLPNLELLELSGNNTIPSLSFIRKIPQLKTLVFSVTVLDGDLSVCDDLSWVYSENNKRHYNRKDNELPKLCFYHGNENIDEWRRFE